MTYDSSERRKTLLKDPGWHFLKPDSMSQIVLKWPEGMIPAMAASPLT